MENTVSPVPEEKLWDDIQWIKIWSKPWTATSDRHMGFITFKQWFTGGTQQDAFDWINRNMANMCWNISLVRFNSSEHMSYFYEATYRTWYGEGLVEWDHGAGITVRAKVHDYPQRDVTEDDGDDSANPRS